MVRLFGFEFRRAQEEEPPSFVPPSNDDGAATVSTVGAYGTVLDLDGTVRTEAELITKYREMSLQPEIDAAIEDIVTEAIIQDENNPIVQLTIDENSGLPDNIKEVIKEEFIEILKTLDFNLKSYDIFKRYYIDGRMYFHALVDPKNPSLGVTEVRYIDPRKIRKVREIKKIRDKSNPEMVITKTVAEYYIYNDAGFNTKQTRMGATEPSVQGIKIAKDSIVHITSGVQDQSGTMVLSHLHKAIRYMNQLRAIQDASVIYRLTRAPERLIFYIDVGNLPKHKAEQHLKDMMQRHKNKLTYDATTGEVKDARRFMTMTENYWFPRRSDGKATEIVPLAGGQNLGEMTDVEYFHKALYKSLNVPITRLDPEKAVSIGRATEITRDEIKFARFIDRLRMRFSDLFTSLLQKQLILKMIITPEEWELIRPSLKYKYARDNYFSELKDSEVRMDRFNQLVLVDQFVGKYVSATWIRKNVLKQTDEDIEQIDAEIAAEMEIPQFNQALMAPPMDPSMGPPTTPLVSNSPPQLPAPSKGPSKKPPSKKTKPK